MSTADDFDAADLTPRGILRFLTGQTEGYPAAILRFLMGLLTIWKGMAAGVNLDRYFTETGVLPWRHVANSEHQIFSLLALAPESRQWTVLVVAAHWVAGIFLVVGFFPRLAALVGYGCALALMHRNPFIDNRGDHLFVLVLGLCMFMPLGRVWSVDAWWRKRKGHSAPLGRVWSQRLLAVQVCYIYLYAFGVKFRAPGWHDGSAIYHTFASPGLVEWPLELTSPILLMGIAWSTIAIEMLFPILVWNRSLRPYCLVVGVLFHAGIELSMRIPMFSTMMMVTYACFLSDEEVRTFLAWLHLDRLAPEESEEADESEDSDADESGSEPEPVS